MTKYRFYDSVYKIDVLRGAIAVYKTIVDTRSEAFEVAQDRLIRQISDAARIDCTETCFVGKGDVSFSQYEKSISFSEELSKRVFW